MNLGQWEVRLSENFDYMLVDVYMIQRLPDRTIKALTSDGTIKTIKNGSKSEGLHFAQLEREQLQAFADALNTFGVKTNNDHKNEGLLEATKSHLEDMCTLVFKKGKL